MDLENLYELAERENIKIYNYSSSKINGCYLSYKGSKFIGLNYKKLNTITKEKSVLAEELGHYYFDATYKLDSGFQLISKQEYKALKWRSLICVPLNSLLKCFDDGIYNLWDIAKELNVEVNMVEFAYNYYKDNGQLFTEDKMLG